MPFSSAEKKEIESIVRKEIKDFLESSTVNQFEKKLIDKLRNELKKGPIRKDINGYIYDALSELYYQLWRQKGTWESNIKNLS